MIDFVACVGSYSLLFWVVCPHGQVNFIGSFSFLADPIVATTQCQLIAAGVAVHGTLSVTRTYFSFETDPTHEENKDIDPAVRRLSLIIVST